MKTKATMSPAQFKALKESVGYTNAELAARLGIKQKQILVYWANGQRPIPPKRANQILDLVAEFDSEVSALRESEIATVKVPRLNDPALDHPAAWYRAVAVRAGKRVSF